MVVPIPFLGPDKIEGASRKVFPPQDEIGVDGLFVEVGIGVGRRVDIVVGRKIVRRIEPLEVSVSSLVEEDLCEELQAHVPAERDDAPKR